MDNATTILYEEKERLENCIKQSSVKLLQVASPAIVQKTQKNHLTGEDVIVSYIELDRFTPETREQFDMYSKRVKENEARLHVFERVVRGLAPQIPPNYLISLHNYNDIQISCNNIGLDSNGEFTKYSIKVGPLYVESKETMTFTEYSQLYTTSLVEQLTKSLGKGFTSEEIQQQLQNACETLYLSPENKRTNTL